MKQAPRFFRTPSELRAWFSKHHRDASELWVGFHKKASGRPSITWPESVDEALCVGWIDGLRKRIDESSYMIRFSPRRPGSIWSSVNVRRVEALTRERRMRAAGRKAFAARRAYRSGIYSYEQRRPELDEPYRSVLAANERARAFFDSQPPSYRKLAVWWIVSAKREETRMKRLAALVDLCARGRRIPTITRDRT